MSMLATVPSQNLSSDDWRAQREAERFLVREAWLLDHDKLEAWLDLLSPNIRYFAPVRSNATRGIDEGTGSLGRLAHFDDTINSLTLRVKRLRTGRAWSEEPASRTRRFVTNMILIGRDSEMLVVGSNILIHREGANEEARLLSAYREDRLETAEATGFILRERIVHIDHLAVPPLTLLF